MLKIAVFVLGLASGAASAVAWLLSEPGPNSAASAPTNPDSPRGRLDILKIRLQDAVTDGQRAGEEKEERLRRELDADRGTSHHSATG